MMSTTPSPAVLMAVRPSRPFGLAAVPVRVLIRLTAPVSASMASSCATPALLLRPLPEKTIQRPLRALAISGCCRMWPTEASLPSISQRATLEAVASVKFAGSLMSSAYRPLAPAPAVPTSSVFQPPA